MPKKNTLITDTVGDAVVEAAILFPVMIMIFSALALLAFYLPTRSALQRATQFAATAVATECSDTWLFFDENALSYYWANEKKDLQNVYVAAFSGRDKIVAKGEDIVIAVEKRNLSSKAGVLSVDCYIVNKIIYSEIVVTATREFKLPVDLSIIGIPDSLSVTVTSTAVIQNADEFIRNLDLSVDFVEYILEKFGLTNITESIGNFGNRVASFLGLAK